ncbi:MAG: sigma-70 family RNA polymerase sigma factor [Candidatus Eisenbacteria sp.]|nr:sigma-70 family RNA polymerase sigma factor [Candidatus Eisenbacteria bacterium]
MTDQKISQYDRDLELAREIAAGSIEAWHTFILRYSGLIYSVLRRYLFNDEDVRTVYVDVLERLYKGRISSYKGRSALSTWLVLVARSTALDSLRKRFGRREMPAVLRQLSKRDRQIFRRFYLDGMSFEAVRHWAAQSKDPLSAEELTASLRRIEEGINRRGLKRMAYNLHASSIGAVSGRLLEFLDHHRAELELAGRTHTPEYVLMEKEAQRNAQRVRKLLESLPEPERQVLSLRFDQGWTAARIADQMGLESPRRAYTLIERGLRKLRSMLGVKKKQPTQGARARESARSG